MHRENALNLMLPKNPFLQLTIPQASKALARVRQMIWTKTADVSVEFAGAGPAAVPWAEAQNLSYRGIATPFHWGKLFDRGWFRLTIPQVEQRDGLFLHWQDQGEGTLYVGGTPYYGFDVAHRYCPLPEGETFHVEGLCLQSGIGHPEAKGLDLEGSRLCSCST